MSLSPPLATGETRPVASGAARSALALIAALAAGVAALLLGGHRASSPPPLARVARSPVLRLADLPATPARMALGDGSAVAGAAARALNAAQPFAPAAVIPARAFLFSGSALDRTRATDCLALAELAEGGSDAASQRAVAQVVLNRVRHPAFPSTVCAVVFQGAERRTGCQFTFTCDGSLARRYGRAAWADARRIADAALNGEVDPVVGTATHYHTVDVHPVWSDQLTKLARVGNQLFYRWPGYWGSAAAARNHYHGGEPLIDAPGMQADAVESSIATPVAAVTAATGGASGPLNVVHQAGGAYFTLIGVRQADALDQAAGALCRGGGYCQVLGWLNADAIPARLPLRGDARRVLAFSHVEAPGSAPITLYDCRLITGAPPDGCIPPAR